MSATIHCFSKATGCKGPFNAACSFNNTCNYIDKNRLKKDFLLLAGTFIKTKSYKVHKSPNEDEYGSMAKLNGI